MYRLAITGGIGSGKSTVRAMLEEMGALGIDADRLAREVVEPGSPGLRLVRERFGAEYLDDDGRLRRERMAGLVFRDPRARRELEELLHPLIRREEERLLAEAERGGGCPLAAVEVPLLTETGAAGRFDGVLLVSAPREVRLERLQDQGRWSREEALARMDSQADEERRRREADFLLPNGGEREETRARLLEILEELCRELRRQGRVEWKGVSAIIAKGASSEESREGG